MAEGNRVDSPPVHLLLEVVEAAADLHRLLLLDAAWTAAEARSDEFVDPDRQALVALGNRLDADVALVERHADALRVIFESYGAWVNQRVSSELASERFTDSQREMARQIVAVEGDDFAGRGAFLAEALAQRAPIERKDLRTKTRMLRGDGPVVTDLSHEFACNILAGVIIAEVALCPESAGLGCALAGAHLLQAHDMGC